MWGIEFLRGSEELQFEYKARNEVDKDKDNTSLEIGCNYWS